MTAKRRYRLPAAEGVLSGEIAATYWGVTSDGLQAYSVDLEGYGEVNLSFPSLLEEIRPPSIDDPVTLPVEIEDDFADACLILRDGPEPLIRVRVREQHLRDRSGTYVTAEFQPTRDGLLRLARGAWLIGTRKQS